MSYKQVRVCDGCGKEIKQHDAYKITLQTGSFLDGAGSRDYNTINQEFCSNCSEHIKNTLAKLVTTLADNKTLNVRPELESFVGEMEKQLKANEYKGGWVGCPYEFLLSELERNLIFVKEYLLPSDGRPRLIYDSDSSKQNCIRRCANIANFAMMLADNVSRCDERPGAENDNI